MIVIFLLFIRFLPWGSFSSTHYWRWGLFAECHLMTGPLLPRHIFA
jgi:hypothetical protein